MLVTVMFLCKLKYSLDAVKVACNKLGLDFSKAENILGNPTIVQHIFDLILKYRADVAYFYWKKQDVFYEVGIAHRLGKNVVPIIH